jgi:hypothetical protein
MVELVVALVLTEVLGVEVQVLLVQVPQVQLVVLVEMVQLLL